MADEHEQDRKDAGLDDHPESGTMPKSPAGESRQQTSGNQEKFVHPLGNARELMGVGFEILASLLGLGLVGYVIDHFAGTAYWCTTIGLILGIIGGLYNAVKKAMNVTGVSPYEQKRSGHLDDGSKPDR